MGWRDAKPVAAGSDWRAARPIGTGEQPQSPRKFDDVEEAQQPTGLQSFASGALQGVTLGGADEIHAGLDTANEGVTRGLRAIGLGDSKPADIEGHYSQESAEEAAGKERGSLADTYRSMRDQYRGENKTAKEANPKLYGTGKLLGNIAVPIPGGAGTGLLQKVGVGAANGLGLGAATGVGESSADLTKGDVGGVVKDAAESGAYGAAGGALGGALGAGASRLATRFGTKAAAADAKAGAMVAKDALKTFRSATGTLGGESGAGLHAVDKLKEAVANPASTAKQVADAKSLLADSQAIATIQRAYDNVIEQFPGRLGKIQAAEKGVQEAAEANTPEALAAAKDALLADPIRKRLVPSMVNRAKRHIVPAIGAGIGGAVAHTLGMEPYLGSAAGMLAGHTSKQLLSHPAVQKAGYAALGGLSEGAGELISKTAPATGLTMRAEDADGNVLYDETPAEEEPLKRRFNR